MLQFQYYNTKLTKKQIDNILNNFNIKYTTVKNEIDSKINNLLKLFMDDILSFLDNIEEISKELKKIKEFDNIKREYELLSQKFKEKTLNVHKLENDIQSLQKEIAYLRNENKNKDKDKDKDKENKEKKKKEIKTPLTTSKNRSFRHILTNKKHMKLKTEFINNSENNDITINGKSNTNTNTLGNTKNNNIKDTSKKNNTQNREKDKEKEKDKDKDNDKKNKILSSSVKRRTKKDTKSKDKYIKDKKSCSPDVEKNKNGIINTSYIDKTIAKIKQYTMNRDNIRFKKIENIRATKKKYRFKRNNDNNVFSGYKKNALTLKNKNIIKKKEKAKDENDLERNMTFEHADKFLKLVESLPYKDKINQNNYSEDDDNHYKVKIDNDIIDKSVSEDSNSEEFDDNLSNEIKELEEDENNILDIMKQIKDFSANSKIKSNN